VSFTLCLLLFAPVARPQGAPQAAAAGVDLPRRNSYPIVLVHGLLGFGREELFGYKYWGGFTDLEAELRAAGFEACTAAVGPVASNWDRACELYACIRGGRVDYGQAHAARHGHERYGRLYPGLVPDWGQPDPATGESRKVHIIGHSLGGPTGRVLIQLLAEGSAEERAATPAGSLSPLFIGGKNWVASLTTISTPHDGTSLVCKYDLQGDLLKPLLAMWIALSATSEEVYYDFKLDQWGLGRQPGEDYRLYRERVLQDDIWRHTKDTAYWDGSPDGARELNRWVPARPEVYYFSWATEATWRGLFGRTQLPELGMPAVMGSLARFMGSYTREAGTAGRVPIDSSWWQNDGIVNTVSMNGPKLGSSDRIVPFSGTPLPGVWNYMGLLKSFDHLDVIGIPLHKAPRGYRSLTDWYLAQAALLASLPAASPPLRDRQAE
jgi:triacylglycerol lipase